MLADAVKLSCELKEAGADLRVSVNLSMRNLLDPEFVSDAAEP